MYSKYSWVCLKDKKGITITKVLQKILDDFYRKPNKILVDKGSKFYNRAKKSWLQDNDIEMNSLHNEEKSVVSRY